MGEPVKKIIDLEIHHARQHGHPAVSACLPHRMRNNPSFSGIYPARVYTTVRCLLVPYEGGNVGPNLDPEMQEDGK
jgi:hypothetical protein